MTTIAADHLELAKDFLRRSREYLDSGDLHQASEKGWGCAAHVAKAIAATHGWEYERHEQFERVIENARQWYRHPDLRIYADDAQALHRYFYWHPSSLDAGVIRERIDGVERMLELMSSSLQP